MSNDKHIEQLHEMREYYEWLKLPDRVAAISAAIRALSPQPQDAAATTRGELVVARDLLLRAMQDEKAEWTGDLRDAAYKALDDVLAKFDAAERAREGACGLLRDAQGNLYHPHEPAMIDSLEARIAAFLAASGGAKT